MADNVAITAGSGTAIAADDISSVWYQRVKLSLGADGTAVDAVAGAGNVSTGVQRVTLATDDAAIAALISAMSGGELTTSTHDAAASTELVQQALYASAAAPTNVSVDGDAVNAWALRNGAQVVNLSAAGALIGGDATNGLDIDITNMIADDAAFTPGTSKVLPVGFEADESSTDSVDEGDVGAARMTLDRKQIVTPQPHTAGGLSIFRSIDLDEGTLEVVKGSPGQVYSMWVTNTATATRFVKFYDATSGTAGTGTPVITVGIPGNSSDDVTGLFGGGFGIAFATGICVGATTAVADNDTGAPGANDVIINIFYK